MVQFDSNLLVVYSNNTSVYLASFSRYYYFYNVRDVACDFEKSFSYDTTVEMAVYVRFPICLQTYCSYVLYSELWDRERFQAAEAIF